MISPESYIQSILPTGLSGRVVRVVGLTVAVAGFPAPLGAVCRIDSDSGETTEGEVVGFQHKETLILTYGELSGIRQGNRVTLVRSLPSVRVGDRLLGRIINGRGQFIDRLPAALLPHRVRLHSPPISPLDRPRIDEPLTTGVRVIDGLLTCGKGQRLGIFAGSGVGKSTLIGQMARSSSADVNVVVLVGERGREVREFLERDLGPEGLARSVVVVATSDEPALIRLRAAYLGTAIAEFFRDQQKDVLLMMDSVTRFALAQREIGLAAGEPPATRGYPPSVFSILPRLLERSGRTDQGSITGFYTVLVEGDDTNEPISDTVRGILDGHVMLSRTLAHRSHWPAVDPLSSISRSMNDIASPEHIASSNSIKQLLAAYRESEDLISIGAYQRGSNPNVDAAIQMKTSIDNFLQQGANETAMLNETIESLTQLSHLRESMSLSQAERPTETVA
ncbi:Flagellum-specific ATP synthase FliI [hydrothermal vent metagenome]|uniref:Flagellum-specific ATP synthase FliI n=1 Tax=hydrothermal vent metagenome TaxID=652676 RepID=A0A3B1DG97_9ZZZZ